MVIYRYITKELILTFLICTIGLNLVLLMEKILKLSKIMAGVGASYTDMLRVLLLIQPQLLIFTIPMALLLCVLLTYGRLGLDNELAVLRSSGMRFSEVARPVMYISAALFILSFMVSLYSMPLAAKILREDINRLIRERAPFSIEPGVFFTNFKGIVLLVSEKRPPDKFEGVFIYDARKPESESVIVARQGILSIGAMNLYLSLRDGTIHSVSKQSSTEIHFSEYDFNIKISGELIGRKRNEMNPFELYKQARRDRRDKNDYFVEFHKRFSFPALIIPIAFLAPSLSLFAGRTGRLGGFIIGMVVFTIYYILMIYIENLVRMGKIHHIACWIPFGILAVFSLLLYRRKD